MKTYLIILEHVLMKIFYSFDVIDVLSIFIGVFLYESISNSMTTFKKRLINKSLSSTIDAKPEEMFLIIIIFPVIF